MKTLSLFSGAGGLDIGFHRAGFDIIGCVEIEKQYCETLKANRNNGTYFNPDAKIYCEDIRNFNPNEFANKGIECVIGGPPCQPFSAAGRRSGGVPGMQDDRGKLFESYCNVLDILRPRVFVFENVYGLKGANNGEAWNEINKSFSALGYTIKAEILDAADYGVPQHRERLILVGTLDTDFIFPEPTNGPDSHTGKDLVSIWEAIKDIEDEAGNTSEDIGGLYGHLLPLVPEGLNYSFFTKEMGYPEPYFAWRSKFHDFLYKADRNRPCRTLKAQPGKFTGPFHWNNRHFTIHELKRIQSFPDDYNITGTNKQIIAQIGNSVPPKLAEVIAVSIKEQILRPTNNLTYPVRSENFKSTFRTRQREISKLYKDIAQKEIEKRFGNQEVSKMYESSDLSKSGEFEQKKETFLFLKKYYIGYINRYSKKITNNRPSKAQVLKYTSLHRVASDCKKGRFKIKSVSCKETVDKNYKFRVSITGLEKYLLKIDTVDFEGDLINVEEVFAEWDIIQKELVDMSQFYSLIDIYGHYANRGDTVRIKTELKSKADSLLVRAINYFGDSSNCGIYLSRDIVAQQLGIPLDKIEMIISMMRELRFDVRTTNTHPTIRTDEIICTYPFPMLSDRVMFDKGKGAVNNG